MTRRSRSRGWPLWLAALFALAMLYFALYALLGGAVLFVPVFALLGLGAIVLSDR